MQSFNAQCSSMCYFDTVEFNYLIENSDSSTSTHEIITNSSPTFPYASTLLVLTKFKIFNCQEQLLELNP